MSEPAGDMIERVAAAMQAALPSPELISPDLARKFQAQAAIRELLEPVGNLIAHAESRHGSLYCHVTTFELRQALGLSVDPWPPTPTNNHEAAPK
ncbi:hypothetical protein DM793_18640 [Paenarthrobacter nitroguajacolicus]|uniref:hypothetical protein n=1 Tax=Paenarthrobacter nitroguajacolicus TaxID=211146 RepID=UPI0015BA5E50|nr:hypothetical protein [Paenarthrobacter nitroguajacolicus]NWL13286.1 hypothetical protein [Paenarthrobacter nitroguajacolicus]